MPYHWKRLMTASLRMAFGMWTMASQISARVEIRDFGAAAMAADSSVVRGNSGTRKIDHRIVVIDSIAPAKKTMCVVCGMPWASTAFTSMWKPLTRTEGVRKASICASPVNAAWVRKPAPCCSGERRSLT